MRNAFVISSNYTLNNNSHIADIYKQLLRHFLSSVMLIATSSQKLWIEHSIILVLMRTNNHNSIYSISHFRKNLIA